MATFTVSIPKELKREIDRFPEINIAEYLKKRFQLKVKELRRFQEMTNRG
ncbi:MAG: hypothetical protein KJ709_01670 [Nanoarchaeota archaeon]|nr:hypothetical protein [Nanoarchaeota archaeon]